jgi:curved DNA-binding protein CbpA
VAGAKRDFYGVLGVGREVDYEGLRKAYHHKAHKVHPDHNPGRVEEATEEFKELVEAYSILRVPELRKEYDELGFGSARVREAGTKARRDAFDLHAMWQGMWEASLASVGWEAKWGKEADRIRAIAGEKSSETYPGISLVEGAVGVSVTMLSSDGRGALVEADYEDPPKNRYLFNHGVKMQFTPDIDGDKLAESVERRLKPLGYARSAAAPSGTVLFELEKGNVASSAEASKAGLMVLRLERMDGQNMRRNALYIQGEPEKKDDKALVFTPGTFQLMPLRDGRSLGEDAVLNDGELGRLRDAFFQIASDVLPGVKRVWVFHHGGLHDSGRLHPSPRQLSWAYGPPVAVEQADVVPYKSYCFQKAQEGKYAEEVRCTESLGKSGRRVYIDPYLTERAIVLEAPMPASEVGERIFRGEWGRFPRIEKVKGGLLSLEPPEERRRLNQPPNASR